MIPSLQPKSPGVDQIFDMVIATLGEAEEHDEHWERQGRAVLEAARFLRAQSLQPRSPSR